MNLDYRFAYLVGDLLIGLPWLALYIYRGDLRRKMLLLSCIFGLFGPLSEVFYLRDYWHPQLFSGWPIGLEDFLFGFFYWRH